MPLTIFDLDNTLLNGDSDHAWGEHLIHTGWVDAEQHLKRNDRFYAEYQAGTLDIVAYQTFVLAPLVNKPWATLAALRDDFVQTRVVPMISQHTRQLIAHHKQQNDELLIITATNRFVTEPIAELLGIANLIATEPEIIDQKITGKIVGTPSFQDGKITRLHQWLGTDNPDLTDCAFYSDSSNDLPLLQAVGKPVAVDPDEALQTHAEQAGWPIISLRPGAAPIDAFFDKS